MAITAVVTGVATKGDVGLRPSYIRRNQGMVAIETQAYRRHCV